MSASPRAKRTRKCVTAYSKLRNGATIATSRRFWAGSGALNTSNVKVAHPTSGTPFVSSHYSLLRTLS